MKLVLTITSALAFLVSAASLNAHCQIPCGIYDDELKFRQLEQDIETIQKSATTIRELSAKDSLSAEDQQQLIR